MPNDDLTIEYDDEGQEFVRLSPADAKAQRELARKAKDNADAAAQLQVAQRELAFARAGIDPGASDLAALFVKGYEGELTAEAIKAAAAKVGLAEAPVVDPDPDPDPQPSAQELEEQRLRQQVATGQTTGTGPTPDPREEAKQIITKARGDGMSEDKALALGMAALREAAAKGDERVIFDPRADRVGA